VAETRIALDDRLLRSGLTVSVADLTAVFADHWPGANAARAPECPRCGHVYRPRAVECPSLAQARSLLARRRFERPDDVPEWIRKAMTAGAPRLRFDDERRTPSRRRDVAPETAEPFTAEPFRATRSSGAYGGDAR
jgi:hypothetical protein